MRKILSIILTIFILSAMVLGVHAAITFPCEECGGFLEAYCPQCGGNYACDTCGLCNSCGATNHTNGTVITLSGSLASAEYTVTVPAKLGPGETGQVVATGAWMPNQTLKVSCPNKVTLSYNNETIDVGINFAGIEQVGSNTEYFNISKDISVEDKSVLFGTWTGHLEYTVEFVEIFTFKVKQAHSDEYYDFKAETNMSWEKWINSNYNTIGAWLSDNYIIMDIGSGTATLYYIDDENVEEGDVLGTHIITPNIQYHFSE